MNYPSTTQCPPQTISYKIKGGDTLYNLAKMYNTTVSAIISANPNINPQDLNIGENICIPTQEIYPSCPEGNYYRILPGDRLYKIADKFNISLDDLIEANPGIEPRNLRIGQIICLPLATPPVTCPEGTFSYTIKPGDTYYSLSIRFGTTIADLTKVNPDINPNGLLVGQSICIPQSWQTYNNITYNVSFMYPASWKKIEEGSFEGEDGYFSISVIRGNMDIERICRNEAYHRSKPYGSDPKIINLEIEGQSSCLIYPSSDQRSEKNNEAALIVKYPKPVTIDRGIYNYFILWAEKSYIRGIGSTLKFIKE